MPSGESKQKKTIKTRHNVPNKQDLITWADLMQDVLLLLLLKTATSYDWRLADRRHIMILDE